MATPIDNSMTVRVRGWLEETQRTGSAKEGESCGSFFKQALGDATEIQDNASQMIEAFVRGEPVEIHEVMAAVEEAGISLSLLVEVRNKLTEAYRTVMNMS